MLICFHWLICLSMFFGEPDGNLNPEVFTKSDEVISDISEPLAKFKEEYDRTLAECLNVDNQPSNCFQQGQEDLRNWLSPVVEECEAVVMNVSENDIETLILEGQKSNLWRGIADATTAKLDCDAAAKAVIKTITNNVNNP